MSRMSLSFFPSLAYSSSSLISINALHRPSDDALTLLPTSSLTTTQCVGLSKFPNVTISEYGSISGADAMQKEIYARGPISCGVDAQPLLQYTGGIYKGAGQGVDHVISVVGWGSATDGTKYWIVRNSWGEFWGEMGCEFDLPNPVDRASALMCLCLPPIQCALHELTSHRSSHVSHVDFRVAFGSLMIEEQCSWAVPSGITTVNYPCYEGGENCAPGNTTY